MTKWRTVRVRQELVTAARRELEPSRYTTRTSLSEFVSEAIRIHLDELKQGYTRKNIAERQYVHPGRLLYTANHMWATVTTEGNVRVGLSDYAKKRLKGIGGIQTDQVGYEVRKDESFGVVETWMFMFDLRSPVSGRIIRINRVLQDNPNVIIENPYEAGWIAEIRPDNLVTLEEELRDLMRLLEYKIQVNKLGRRAQGLEE